MVHRKSVVELIGIRLLIDGSAHNPTVCVKLTFPHDLSRSCQTWADLYFSQE
jgi:hypothetical protein